MGTVHSFRAVKSLGAAIAMGPVRYVGELLQNPFRTFCHNL